MSTPLPFGVALTKAREAAGLSQTQIASRLRTLPNTVHRWEKRRSIPSMEVRIALLRLLAEAPRALLEDLAEEANVDLASIGMGPPPPPVTALPSLSPTAQATVDDALREAAEEIDVTPRVLRPALSRMLDRLARSGVPIDAAARMVLGVPKKAEG
ncbi:MAG: helix-turn-helix domain-containing protein [Polyangiaceae bacterium]|jgi:transcriptional regulator with XRE-family HTH domain